MRHFNNPALGFFCGVAFEFAGLLPTPFDMRDVAMPINDLPCWFSGVTSVGTQVFVSPLGRLDSLDHDAIKYGLQLRDVMPVGSCHDERQRDATTVHQQMTFAAIFFPDPLGWGQRLTEPMVLSSWPRRCFASAKRCLRDRRTQQAPLSTGPQRRQLSPIAGIEHGSRWRCHTARRAVPSIGSLLSTRTRCLQKQAWNLWACVRHRPCGCTSDPSGAGAQESVVLRASKNHP